MAFPTNPTNGQVANVNGVQYTYSSALTAWSVTSSGGSYITAVQVTSTGNITGGNVTTAGLVTATGNITGGNVTTSGLISVTGNIISGNVTTAGLVSATGNVTSGNVTTGGLISVTGNIISGNVTTAGLVSATGNITGGNLTSAGLISVTGNVTGNNISTATAFFTKTILETATITASAFANPTNYDILTQSVWYSTANASVSFTLNIRGNSSVTANTLLSTGQSMSFALLVTNGATPYYPSAYQVDGSAITPKYLGGTVISSGNANSIDVYTYTLIKTAATPTYTLLVTQSKFA